jgi:hypothetical protein
MMKLSFLAEIDVSSCRFFVCIIAEFQLRILCDIEWKTHESAELHVLRVMKSGNRSASGPKINHKQSLI